MPGGRLNQSAAPFTPSSSARKITLRAPDGSELKFDKFKQNGQQPAASPATPTVTSPRKPVKIEKPTEAHEKRIAAEKAEAEAKAKKEREQKEKEEKERKEKEEKERKAKEEAERKKAEEEKARKEEEEKARKEAEEKAKREEEERVKEEERKKAEEAEKLKQEEERKKEEEERKKTEEAAKPTEAKEEVEEGEIKEPTSDAQPAADEKVKFPSAGPDPQRKRPGPLNLKIAQSTPIDAPLPSALATARAIDDIGSVHYPEGIKSPLVELNTHAKDGKFRFVLGVYVSSNAANGDIQI